MLIFEGVIGIADTRILLRANIDEQALYMQAPGGAIVLRVSDMTYLPPEGRDLFALIKLIYGELQSPPRAGGASVLRSLVGDMPIPNYNLPSFMLVTPGITAMKLTRRCDSGDFSPVAGVPVDLSGADLSGVVFGAVDFSPAILTGTNFAYATLGQARFAKTQLAGRNLEHASLIGADLRNLDLTGTIFDNAQLSRAQLQNTTLVGAKFRKTQFDGADFYCANATGAVFDGATAIKPIFLGTTLTNSTFVGARLANAAFNGATLDRTSFKDALLAGASFSARGDGTAVARLTSVDFDNTDLRSADFTGVTLNTGSPPAHPPRFGTSVDTRTSFVRAIVATKLIGTDWSYIDATGATFTTDASLDGSKLTAVHAILPKMSFAGRKLPDADFSSADLRQARFGECALKDAKFNQAVLEGADFTSANLEGADFTSANLVSSVFAKAWLSGAKFERSVLASTNFSSAMLAQVSFTGIQGRSLSGVNFAGACLVSADFKDVAAPRAGSTQTNFSTACLAGADFTGATLSDVMLTGAQLSSRAGELKVSHPVRTAGKVFSYDKTRLLSRATGPDTTCPDGNGGVCSDERLFSRAVPAEWKP